MKPLMLAVLVALLTACLVALVWHRPDPKHEFVFDLVRGLQEPNSIITPPSDPPDAPANHGGVRLSMMFSAGGLA